MTLGFTRRLLLGYGASAAVLASAWLAFAYRLAPGLIGSMYDRASLPVLNDMITGQNNFPVEFYLNAWLGVRGKATAAVLVAILLVVATAPLHGRVLRRTWTWLRMSPTIGFLGLAAVGGSLGWLGGSIEAAWEWGRHTGLPYGPSIEQTWMAPTAGAAVGIALALVLSVVCRNSVSLRAGTSILATAFLFSVIRDSALGIHPAAACLLAAGVGLQAAVLAARRPASVERVARRLFPALMAVSLLTAISIGGREVLAERRASGARPAAPAGAPDVLLVIIDTQRASRMSLYGHQRPTTPNIDRLAERSVVFDMALSTTSWTLPGHASMLTGLWANELETNFRVRVDEGPETLAEVMAKAGYATAGFVANYGYVATRSGIGRGFDRYDDHPLSGEEWLASHWLSYWVTETTQKLLGIHRNVRKRAEAVNREFLDWQERQHGPYFAMLNYFDVHDFYESPSPFDTLYRNPPPRHWVPTWGFSNDYSDGDVAEMLDAYDSALTYLDTRIGELFAELEARGALDNTIVILTSDHGEHFGEREMALHGNSLYVPVVQVPLLISFPGRVPEAFRVGAAASIRDIPATVLELAGMDARLPGASLSRHWSSDPAERDPLFLNLKERVWFMPQDIIRHGTMNGVVLGSLHYIVDGRGVEELYDVEVDPEQIQNLVDSPEHQEELERLRAALAQHSAAPER